MTSGSSVAEMMASPNNDLILPAQEVNFPAGLLGFPMCRRYRLEPFNLGNGDPSPFLILNCLDQELSFPLIHPSSIALDYRFPVNGGLLTALGAESEEQLITLLIVTVRDRLEDITLNLQGPLVVNRTSSLGLQLVLEEYPVRYPLFKTAF
jgi:flagellar assembly factor FliW